MTECFILGMYASFQINVKPLLPDVLDYINTCKTVLKLVLGLVLVNSLTIFHILFNYKARDNTNKKSQFTM